jgi:tetratricopeptide (TPR) repeat protein
MWNYSFRVSPDSPLVHLFQGVLLEQRDANFAGAAREYERALRLNEVSFRPAPGIAYECYLGLGRVALVHGRWGEGIRYYEQAVRLAPSHSPAYRALGAAYFPRGDYAKAAGYFVQAVKFNPQDVEARFFLGTCWMKLGKPREAVAQFHAAREVDPTYDQAFEAEARALEAAGERAEAARVRSRKAKP